MLDRRLDGRGYIVGVAITMADITAFVTVDFAAWIKLPVPEALTNLRRWYEAMSDRPSAKL